MPWWHIIDNTCMAGTYQARMSRSSSVSYCSGIIIWLQIKALYANNIPSVKILLLLNFQIFHSGRKQQNDYQLVNGPKNDWMHGHFGTTTKASQ